MLCWPRPIKLNLGGQPFSPIGGSVPKYDHLPAGRTSGLMVDFSGLIHAEVRFDRYEK